MESSTKIHQMMGQCEIFVPVYQRAYSWDVSTDNDPKQVNQFLKDLQEFLDSGSKQYYLGHFLYEEITEGDNKYAIVDGQQRMTTIVIFVSALVRCLEKKRKLEDQEKRFYEDIVLRGSSMYHFSTVEYDNRFFRDFVIEGKETGSQETVSQRRIAGAYSYFADKFLKMDADSLSRLLNAVCNAQCSTHVVKNECEAVQMFMFQNARGKKPTRLELLKTQFMAHIHLYAENGNEKSTYLKEISDRFEHIYKSIAKIEDRIDEMDVLSYAEHIYFNQITDFDAKKKINDELRKGKEGIAFVKDFSNTLATCFDYITDFYQKEKEGNLSYHYLSLIGRNALFMPFMVKAYFKGVEQGDKDRLAESLTSLALRSAIIGTRADLSARLKWAFENFDGNVQLVIDHIKMMKTTQEWWWAYWNNENLKYALQWGIDNGIAKKLLLIYENSLRNQCKRKEYETPLRYDKTNFELEHIAPQTENPEHGYQKYTEEFVNNYLNSLGNFLLLSKSHNCSIGNKPFEEKLATYNYLEQHKEVQKMAADDHIWNQEKIERRRDKLIDFIMSWPDNK